MNLKQALALADDPDAPLVLRAFAIELKKTVAARDRSKADADAANTAMEKALHAGHVAAIEGELLLRLIREHAGPAPGPVDTDAPRVVTREG